MNRTTIARPVTVTGTALHAGVPVTMTLESRAAGEGVVFRRADLANAEIPARYDRVGETRLGTVIEKDGASVGVVEHLMAAVAGAEIDDLTVILDGPEPPILDGDALSYGALLEQAGRQAQLQPRRAIKVLKEIVVDDGKARAALIPAAGLSYHLEISYPSAAIGTQKFDFEFSRQAFAREIAPARTFGFLQELDYLKSIDRGHGASLENTLAIDGDIVRNRGDMALAGAPLIARFEGSRSGHGSNNALLRKLFSDPGNYEIQLLS
jgi:UDP-3-O-[3-hydroxymyristoyl] N-acetylglucosamine deacetylase